MFCLYYLIFILTFKGGIEFSFYRWEIILGQVNELAQGCTGSAEPVSEAHVFSVLK